MKNNAELCPFSKPILGKWCHCPHAKLADRCSGKMTCLRQDDLQSSCVELVEAFKQNTRFILGLKNDQAELTHAQLMKIRCGGLLGMQRIYNFDINQSVDIRHIIDNTINQYGKLADFPFDTIVKDIKDFHHRK